MVITLRPVVHAWTHTAVTQCGDQPSLSGCLLAVTSPFLLLHALILGDK